MDNLIMVGSGYQFYVVLKPIIQFPLYYHYESVHHNGQTQSPFTFIYVSAY